MTEHTYTQYWIFLFSPHILIKQRSNMSKYQGQNITLVMNRHRYEDLSYSVAQSCTILCKPMDCSTPGFCVLYYFPEFAQTHVHWVDDAIQPSHPLSPSSPSAFSQPKNLGLFQWVDFSHQVAQVLELHV